MRKKWSKKLLSIFLSGILFASNISTLSVYAAEETETVQTQDVLLEQLTEQEPSETVPPTETEDASESDDSAYESNSEIVEDAEPAPTQQQTTEDTMSTDITETTEEATVEQEYATEKETLSEETTDEETTDAETTDAKTTDEENTETAETLKADTKEDTDVPTPQQVYERMIALQDEFPEGRYWTDASSGDYTWKGGRGENNDIARIGTGCVHFAYRLSDAAFGDLPARRLYPGGFTFADIKVGDILRIEHNAHSVIVLQVNDASVVIAEGNYNKSIHWGRILTKDEVEAADHVLTRYPKGYIPPDDPEANTIIAEGGFDSEEFEDYKGTLTWKLTTSGTLTISGSGEMPDFNFGGTSDALVSNRPWNEYNSQINKVVIEDGVTGISTNAFRCSVAYSISIPTSVKTIGNDAFRQCKNIILASPDGVVTIGERAFRGCENLKGIVMPGSLKSVGSGAFYDCTALEHAKFLSGGNTVTMGDNIFSRCWNLSDVTLPAGLETISKEMFSNCLVLSELSIPAGVKTIAEGAFKGCSRLTSIFIPKSVTEIEMQAFTNSGLAEVSYEGSESEWSNVWIADAATRELLNTIKSNGNFHYGTQVSVEPYIVSFYVQEHGTAPKTIEVKPGEKITKPDDPSADGYIFEGWYKDAECTNAWNFDSDTVKSDMILYAKWSKDPQNPDDQNPGDQNPGDQNPGDQNPGDQNPGDQNPGDQNPDDQNPGDQNPDDQNPGDQNPDDQNPDDPNPDDQNPSNPNPSRQFTVSFNVRGHGNGIAPKAVTVEAGKTVTKPVVDSSTDICHYIEGWYQDVACQKAWNFSTDTVQFDITLYAKWAPKDIDTSRLLSDQRKNLKSVNAAIATNIKPKGYDGTPYKPAIKITAVDSGKTITLTEGADYRVSYENNIAAGTGKVIVRGNGIYKGEITKEFEITKKPVKKLTIVTGGMASGTTSALPVYVYDNTTLLKENTDYILSAPVIDSKGATAAVTITAAANSSYTGSVTAKVTIYNAESDKIINPENVTLSAESAAYTGKAVKSIEPTVTIAGYTLKKNKEYKIQYKNNIKVGTAYIIITGKGAYKGKVIKPFTITESTSAFTIKPIPAQTYNGKLQKPSVTVTAGTKKLKANTDYIITYANNTLAGEAVVCITGIGNYAGAWAQTTFTINPQKISKASIKTSATVGLTLTYNKKQLTEGIDYTLAYGEEKNGKTVVTITGINDFTDTKTKSVKTTILTTH